MTSLCRIGGNSCPCMRKKASVALPIEMSSFRIAKAQHDARQAWHRTLWTHSRLFPRRQPRSTIEAHPRLADLVGAVWEVDRRAAAERVFPDARFRMSSHHESAAVPGAQVRASRPLPTFNIDCIVVSHQARRTLAHTTRRLSTSFPKPPSNHRPAIHPLITHHYPRCRMSSTHLVAPHASLAPGLVAHFLQPPLLS